MSTLHPDYTIVPVMRAHWKSPYPWLPIESVVAAIFALPEDERPERATYMPGEVTCAILAVVFGMRVYMTGIRDHELRWVRIERLVAD
jgi:hypothetical protein